MTTPPTPAEVAEAIAYFRWVYVAPDEFDESELIGSGNVAQKRFAAVLVRAALADTTRDSGAAPAEQPREVMSGIEIWASPDGTVTIRGEIGVRFIDEFYRPPADAVRLVPVSPSAVPAEQPRDDEVESIAVALWHLWGDVSSGAVARPGPVDDRFHELIARVRALAARSVSPSAVPAVSAGGAGRDLTAADVESAMSAVPDVETPQVYFQRVVDRLNRIARPADTGTQAIEYRTVTDHGTRHATVSRTVALTELRRGTRVESRLAATPWSPVAVHDEEKQR